MSNRIIISPKNVQDYFYLEKLLPDKPLVSFMCSIDEYNDYLFLEKFKGIGSFMINAAKGKAIDCNEDYCAARFLTVDADIEHDKGVLAFYEKNDFVPNAEFSNKNRKTISMRKDIWT